MSANRQIQHYLDLSKELIGNAQLILEVPLVVAKTQDHYLIDCNGKKYLDFISGACTQNLGFNQRVQELSSGFPFPYAPGLIQLEYAKKLLSLYKSTYKCKLTFGVCGSEGIDAAIKYSRAYTKRKKIVSFYGDYHGTTFGSCTLTTMPGRMSKSFSPMVPECYAIPFVNENDDESKVLSTIEELLALDPSTIAGFVFESVQGDMGMLPCHKLLMQKLKELSHEYGFLLIADEIQLAYFRTGPFFSFENYEGLNPDLIVMGKNLGGGIPLSAVIGKSEILDSLTPGEHDFTLAGNSEACTRGLDNLNEILRLKESGEIDALATLMRERLDRLCSLYPALISKVTGKYLAYGLWLKSFKKFSKAQDTAAFMVKRCFDLGLYTQRLSSSWLRLEPFLNMSQTELNQGFDIIEKALEEAYKYAQS